jgi:hypothetical protein
MTAPIADLPARATEGSNRLAVLGSEITAAHEAAERAKLTSLERAKEAGAKLIEAKELLGHGKWLAWLKTIGLPQRTAHDYMQIAGLSKAELATVADLGLRAALEKVRQPRPDDPAPDDRPEWTESQLDRKARAEAGECVVASMRDGVDEPLLQWAEHAGRLVRVDRQSDFGNPFVMPDDGDRGEVIGKFEKFYWPHKPALLAQIADWQGKVLVCWCHPEDCHAEVIAATANAVFRGEGTAQQVADRFADSDG